MYVENVVRIHVDSDELVSTSESWPSPGSHRCSSFVYGYVDILVEIRETAVYRSRQAATVHGIGIGIRTAAGNGKPAGAAQDEHADQAKQHE